MFSLSIEWALSIQSAAICPINNDSNNIRVFREPAIDILLTYQLTVFTARFRSQIEAKF